ncbi:MAG: 4-(cytidine 5'-diphospho)-2-C-methyl-D-erythritol kinase [Oscillospiraceae bacterium]|nr:4-(cytidine 5'-diphospho)-2-C-methyl-D-erythritol kinase [Oscillospiraceae bacterium]
MIVHANGKLNLSLDVLGRTDGGYHDMRMVMQSVSFGDDLDIRLTKDGTFFIDPGQRYLPRNEKNLALRAARLFLDGSGLGASIRITKRLPVCAGLGGGSADAAAVLVALNEMTGAGKTEQELCVLGLQLGSDVPFCIQGGTALAEGRGERLTALSSMPDCPIVICKPAFAISTPELFGRIDARRSRLRPDTKGILTALEEQDLYGVARRMYNVFEDVLDRRQSAVPAIKRQLIDQGAINAAMTGTGSAVFGLFEDEKVAKAAVEALSPANQCCVLTRPADTGCVLI